MNQQTSLGGPTFYLKLWYLIFLFPKPFAESQITLRGWRFARSLALMIVRTQGIAWWTPTVSLWAQNGKAIGICCAWRGANDVMRYLVKSMI